MGIGPGVIAFWVVCGVVGGLAGSGKPKIGGVAGFFLGLLLGPLGLIVVLASKGAPDPTTLQRVERRPDDPAPAWHPDPLGRFDSRWWDGDQWTAHVGRVGPDGTRGQYEDPV